MSREECGGDNCPGDTTKKVRRDDIPNDQRKMGGVICSNPIHYRNTGQATSSLAEFIELLTDPKKLDDFRMKATI